MFTFQRINTLIHCIGAAVDHLNRDIKQEKHAKEIICKRKHIPETYIVNQLIMTIKCIKVD